MKYKAFATSALVASLSFAPVPAVVAPAHADTGDVVAGLIIGGIVGAAINEGSKKKSTKSGSKSKSKSTKSKAPSMSAEQRAANIGVQDSLNYFGWNVGGADGVLGAKSKTAIKEYQAFLGEGITGDLTEDQRLILTTAHARSKAGGAVIQDIVAGSVYGVRGVLLAQRDEMRAAGGKAIAASASPAPGTVAAAAAAAIPALLPPVPVAAAPVVAAPAPPVILAPAPAPVVIAAPEPAAVPKVAAAESALPSFMDSNGTKGSLSAECDAVSLAATAKGGYATAATMADAGAALGEQFCLTRAAAIVKGQELSAKVAGFTPEQIAQQCAAFGPVLKDQVAALSMRPADEVIAGVEAFILNSGMSPAQLSGTAKVCLGVGYAQDQLDVAIGSALLLTAMGEDGYAELLGHHLSQGFGATARADLAMGWYDIALGSLEGGADVFVPGAPGRDALVKKAAYTIAGRAGELAPEAVVQEAALPSFAVPDVPAVVPAPTPAPVTEVAAPIPAPPVVEVATAPEPAAPVAAITSPTPADEVIRVGAEAAMTAARLPFLLFGAN